MRLSVGHRVNHEYLGIGRVVQVEGLPLDSLCLVSFDTTLPIRYNMGENPTVVFIKDLEVVADRSKEGQQGHREER